MRGVPPDSPVTLKLKLPARLVADARLYSGRSHDEDAVCHVLQDYGRLVGEVRELRRRLVQFDQEQADFDGRLEALQAVCRAILDL